MEGIHIVAFAEEDDPGRRPYSSLCDSPSFKKVYFHVLCLHCKHLLGVYASRCASQDSNFG